MSEFQAYLQLGFNHITDSLGYDHILFIMALCTVYTLIDWKKVIVLVTAFTIGHSITLALSTMGFVNVNPDWIELLIPVTIVITAVLNFFYKVPKASFSPNEKSSQIRYPIALFFGLIHGLGFSNYLRTLLGKEADIVNPLLGFNIGLELGQLIIVFIILSIAFVMIELLRVQRLSWIHILSGIIVGMSLSLIINNEFLQNLLA
ncbi:HupE/UreJ family protein [Dyadobacter chenwenxiniae]|uniref:HupE/UreJ family protein n=1 Tax=Dyadobacter chenwenxiniae TaxID=2906456 RepID=A0A9X1PJV2_9BACT|nr:HupE/UreJ family protein [Dyadobacter chenwenxiniae]MCF0049206.1 HupE/UreJ family protein [Dyadobacter chenwenxiniae]MCF0061715.1 HupE/UreJ family protein [Dyadobacter chenwenxiniae]UON81533.1 HupE/UreJ family protein [Dyadobacter chenwenxiniae]